MTQAFSKIRLIDYFAIIDLDIKSLIDNQDSLTISNFINLEPIIPKCSHRLLNFFPKKLYKDCYDTTFDSFNHIINNLTNSLPKEELYLSKQETRFFSLLYTEPSGQYYYGHYLRVYEEYTSEGLIYKILPKELRGKKIFGPKYLCFVSWNPFFFSFKSILEEIYSLSNENSNELIKVENILNFILFRIILPKYEDTQLSFTLNYKIYRFNTNMLYSELSLKILFQIISIENIVKIVFAYLMHSWIIFIHSNIEIIGPIISAFLSLVVPFPPSYSIIVNLEEKMVDVLGCPVYAIVGVYKQSIPEIDIIIKKKIIQNKNASYAICDLDKKEVTYLNVDINASQTKELEDKLIKKLKDYSNLYDSSIETKKIDVWKEYQSLSLNINNDRSETQIHSMTIKGKGIINTNITKKFDEIKIRANFLNLIATLCEAFDEEKHFKTENYNKYFDLNAFILDSKENLKEFLKVFVSTPLWDIFIQNITYIVNSKYKEKLKSELKSDIKFDMQKNTNTKSAAVLNRCDRVYELFVKAIEKKNHKKSLFSLFKIKITHNISLPHIAVENIYYSQTGIFDNHLNEIKFTHNSSISLHNNNLNIPFATLKENPLTTSSIKNFISKESLSNYTILNEKVLCEDYINYYKKNYDHFINFFGFSSKLDNIQTKLTHDDSSNSKSVRLQRVMELKDNYIGVIQKIVGATNIFPHEMVDEKEIISTNRNYTNEFNINIGVNVIQTVSLCEFCKIPNSLWEIHIRYEKKPEKKSKVLCKNCKKPFVAQFIVIDEHNDEDEILGNKANLSFESTVTDKSIIDIRNELREKKTNLKKIDYMSMEQIHEFINTIKLAIDDQIDKVKENEKPTTKQKKEKEKFTYPNNKQLRIKYPSLYHNLLLLFGDFKIISENNGEILTFNIDEYIIHLEKKNKSYVNRWKKNSIVEKSKSKEKKIKKSFLTKRTGSLNNKEFDKKKVFKCELKNFMTKFSHDKFMEDNKKLYLQQNTSLNKTEMNSVAYDYRHSVNKTNDNISEIYQTKRSEFSGSTNSINPNLIKRVNTSVKDKFNKYTGEEDLRDNIVISPFHHSNMIEHSSNKGNIMMGQTKRSIEDQIMTSNFTKKKSSIDIIVKTSKTINQNSNYKNLFCKKQFINK